MTMLICRLLGSALSFSELRQNAQDFASNHARRITQKAEGRKNSIGVVKLPIGTHDATRRGPVLI